VGMARIGTTKLAITVYIVNIGSGETSLNKTLVKPGLDYRKERESASV